MTTDHSTLNTQLKLDIQPRYAFDLRHELPNQIRFLTSSRLILPVGRHFGVQQLSASNLSSSGGGGVVGGSGSNDGEMTKTMSQMMGFLVRKLGHPPPYEEGPIEYQTEGTNPTTTTNSPNKLKPMMETISSVSTDYAYLSNYHWNTQTLVRLQMHERDYLSRNESQLLSCFSVHPVKKLIAFTEYSTELRIVTVTISDIYTATEEDFSSLTLRRFRLNFLLIPCVQHLTSDRGRREARDRRVRHARRKALLRRVALWKANKAKLEDQRLEELRRETSSTKKTVAFGQTPTVDEEAYSSEILEELRALKVQIDEAEVTLAQEKHPDSDSDLEGYGSDELHTDEEAEEKKDNEYDDDYNPRDLGQSSRLSNQPQPLNPFASPASTDGLLDASGHPQHLPHHQEPTESWTHKIKDVKAIYDTEPGIKYADDYSALDAITGPPPPAIPDHSKEELLFSRIVCIEWSKDGKYVVMCGDGPRFPLFIWEIATKEMIGAQRYMNQPAFRAEFRPVPGPLSVITMGRESMRLWEVKTKFTEHSHDFTQPVYLQDGEHFVDFTYLTQMRNAMIVLTSMQIHILHQDQIVSSMPFSTSFLSIPRCVTPTEKGYAVGLDGQVLLYEFKSANTLYIGPDEFRDAEGKELKAHDRKMELEAYEKRLVDAAHEEVEAQKQRREEEGLFQNSLFERLYHLRQQSQSLYGKEEVAPTPGKKGAKKSPIKKSPNSKQSSDPPTTAPSFKFESSPSTRARENFDVFLAKTIPLFRPIPGATPPPIANIPTILAAQVTPTTAASSSSDRNLKSSKSESDKRRSLKPSNSSASVPPGSEIFRLHSMVCSPDQHTLVLTSTTREIISIKLKDVEVCSTGEELQCVSTITSGLHHGPITDMAVCAEQPLIVSCSNADNSVRIHNYLERECEIIKNFQFTPLCVSFHPLGHEIAVGFHVNLFTFRIYPNELHLRGEMAIPNVSLCAYSHGGQYLAAVTGKTIMVYATNTCKTVAKLIGHADAIMAIYWNSEDSSLFSVGLQGHMYEWSMHTHTRVREYVSYDSAFVDIAVSPTGEIAIAGVSTHTDDTFCLHHHEPSQPYQFSGGFHYSHYLPPDETTQNLLNVGVGINNQQRSLGLYPGDHSKSKPIEQLDPQFSAAYGYAARSLTSTHLRASPLGMAEDFHTIQYRAHSALPVASSYSRILLAHEQLLTNPLASSPSATTAKSRRTTSILQSPNLVNARTTRSEGVTTLASDPLLEAYRSESFPTTTPPSAFRPIRPPHSRLAWIQMGRVWFLLAGTHRGSLEIFRTPLLDYPEPMFEVGLHTEPISSVRVCQKLGVIITASIDGSMIVSSLAMIPFTFLTRTLPNWALSFPEYVCLLPNFFRGQLFPHLATNDFKELYADQRNRLQLEREVHEKYRRIQIEKKFYGSYRLTENEEDLGHASDGRSSGGSTSSFDSILVKRQTFMDMVASLTGFRSLKKEFAQEWEFKLLKDAREMKKVLKQAEETYTAELGQHLEEKKRLFEKDLNRESELRQQYELAETSHINGINMLERIYERKLALEAEKTKKIQNEYHDRNMRLSKELEKIKAMWVREMKELKDAYEQEKENHELDRHALGVKLKQIEDESIAMLEEQDLEHDQDRAADRKDISNRVGGLRSTLLSTKDDNVRLQAELDMLKLKNKSLNDQISEWRVRYQTELEQVKGMEAKLKAEKLQQQLLETDLSTKVTQITALESNVSKLETHRTNLREQVASLLQQLEANDIPKAKRELEEVVRELDGEFEEKALEIKKAKKELHDTKARISVLTKENAALTDQQNDAVDLLNRLREDLIRFKDIRALKDKYSEFIMTTAGPNTFRRKIENEFSRQLQFYSHNNAALQAKLNAAEAQLEKNNGRRITDQIHIMRQVNDLRHRNKDYQETVVALASDLNAMKLKERLKFRQRHEELLARNPLHTPKSQVNPLSKNHLSKILSTYVDPEMREYRSKSGKIESEAQMDFTTEAVRSRQPDQLKYDAQQLEKQAFELAAAQEEHANQTALVQERMDLMRQMKDETEKMLVNSYRRINEQEEEISLLRKENERMNNYLKSTGKVRPPTAASSSTSTPQPPSASFSTNADYVDSILSAAAQKRQEAGGNSTPTNSMISPRPPSSARQISTSISALSPSNLPLSSPRHNSANVSGSQSARTPSSSASSVTPRANPGVPYIYPPKRWQVGYPPAAASASPTSSSASAAYSPSPVASTTLTPRASAVIAQAKAKQPHPSRMQRALQGGATTPSTPAVPQFDMGVFEAAMDLQTREAKESE